MKEEMQTEFDNENKKMKKQNFWMTAITFKIKSMIQ